MALAHCVQEREIVQEQQQKPREKKAPPPCTRIFVCPLHLQPANANNLISYLVYSVRGDVLL